MTKQEFDKWWEDNAPIDAQKITDLINLKSAEAIAEHEAKQWHYEDTPDTYRNVLAELLNGAKVITFYDRGNKVWGYNKSLSIRRWRELPQPYQPQEGGDTHTDEVVVKWTTDELGNRVMTSFFKGRR